MIKNKIFCFSVIMLFLFSSVHIFVAHQSKDTNKVMNQTTPLTEVDWYLYPQIYAMTAMPSEMIDEYHITVNGLWNGFIGDNLSSPFALGRLLESVFGGNTYDSDADFVQAQHDKGMIVPGTILTIQGHRSFQQDDFDTFASRSIDGALCPWDKGADSYWMNILDPGYLEWCINHGKKAIDAGADIIVLDEIQGNSLIPTYQWASQYTGDPAPGFSDVTINGFQQYLIEAYSSSELSDFFGIPDINTYDLKTRIADGFSGTIGIITSFKEQQARMEQAINEKMNLPQLKRNHNLAVWFVGDVQGEERDVVYYSLVEDKKYGNANLGSIYPVIGGAADTIRSLKMQRLNVGFSRAKDNMVFVHSMPLGDYSRSRLGDALKHYQGLLETTAQNDFFVEDPSVFESPAEERLYRLLVNTRFVETHRENLKIVPQFNIGEYIRAQYRKQIPRFRVDFLITLAGNGREQALILEYDGVEYHTKNPDIVTGHNFTAEYLDYDISRQIELESYGYRFLRINKFNLRPEQPGQTEADVLDGLLTRAFAGQ